MFANLAPKAQKLLSVRLKKSKGDYSASACMRWF